MVAKLVSGIVTELLVKKRMERYRNRDSSIIYVHYLGTSVWAVLEGKEEEVNGFMVIGEIIHAGLEAIANPPPQACKEVQVPEGIDERVRRRFVFFKNGAAYVRVCGTPDALLEDGVPVELKTTRRRIRAVPESWKRQAMLYAWLFNKHSILAVINVIDGSEVDYVIEKPPEKKVETIIIKWLLGQYPYVTLRSSPRD